MPLIRAAFNYPSPEGYQAYQQAWTDQGATPEEWIDLHPCMLVIDPKQDLHEYIRTLALNAGQDNNADAVREVISISLRERNYMIWLFEGITPANLNPSEVVDRLFSLSNYIEREQRATRDPFWAQQAGGIIRAVIAIDHFLYQKDGLAGLRQFWGRIHREVSRSLGFAQRAPKSKLPTTPAEKAQGGLHDELRYNRNCYLRPVYTLFNLSTVYHREGSDAILQAYLDACQHFEVPTSMWVRLRSLPELAHNTYSSITAVINGFLEELASLELAQYVSLNPYEAPDPEKYLSVEDRLNMGDCVVYTPGIDSDLANLIGRCIKMKFFELSFNRRNRMRPFFYICDEFQRYITGDKVSGEQSFLDRCRAYRVVCVLATQSLSSLSYRLSSMTGENDRQAAQASLDVLLNNTGNKFFFRGTDTLTHDWIHKIMPQPYVYGKPHIISVRPPSTLGAGECYYLLGSGQYGRAQVLLSDNPMARQLRQTRDSAAQQRFEAVCAAIQQAMGDEWQLDFKGVRSYQQAWKAHWNRPDLWIHYEFYFNREDLMDAQERFEVAIHVERTQRRKFLARFQRRRKKHLAAYLQHHLTFMPSNNRVVGLARRMYSFNALQDDIPQQFIAALSNFMFLNDLIDDVLTHWDEPEDETPEEMVEEFIFDDIEDDEPEPEPTPPPPPPRPNPFSAPPTKQAVFPPRPPMPPPFSPLSPQHPDFKPLPIQDEPIEVNAVTFVPAKEKSDSLDDLLFDDFLDDDSPDAVSSNNDPNATQPLPSDDDSDEYF